MTNGPHAAMDLPRADPSVTYPILFGQRWPTNGLAEAIAALDVNVLCAEYAELREAAPKRSKVGKPYFVEHTGFPSTGGSSNRAEEHTAIALRNLDRFWPLSPAGWFRLLDYQVPLKASHADAGIGKIDLLGVSDRGRMVIVELKVGRPNGRGDPPPMALMEALRYAAIIEADLEAIASETFRRFGVKLSGDPPMIVLLAPGAWWRSWIGTPGASVWLAEFCRLLEAVETRTGIATGCVAFDDIQLSFGQANLAPRLGAVPDFRPVNCEGTLAVGDALPPLSPAPEAAERYAAAVTQSLWAWADRHHAGQLDGGPRAGRPPVLRPEFAELNVVVAEEDAAADKVRSAITLRQRHRYFASMRSSQALAQSVFGAIQAHDRLDLLQDVRADCGRLAFFQDPRGWRLAFEHEVKTLGNRGPRASMC